MSKQGFQETLIASQVAGNTITTSTTEFSIIPPAARFTLPTNFFSEPGKSLRISSRGMISANATGPGTLVMDIRLGASTANIVFGANAINLNTNATSLANIVYEFEALLTCRSIGTSATLMSIGSFSSLAANGGVGQVAEQVMLPVVTPIVSPTFDSTTTLTIDHFAKFSVSNANNNITCHQFIVESLN